MSPMIKGKDGSETYAMSPQMGEALQRGRDAEAEKPKGKIKRAIIEKMDDGTAQSSVEREGADKPETATHDSWGEAADCVGDMDDDEESD